MKQEYKGKLELCKKLLHESLYVESDEIGNKMFDDGYNLMKDLIKTKNIEVLYELFDLFTEENENGVCETLDNDIWDNFSEEQVINVFQGRFLSLLEKNMLRACTTSIAIINTGHFDSLRKIFNDSKSVNSQKFFDELSSWIGADYPNEIAILQEDMKKW